MKTINFKTPLFRFCAFVLALTITLLSYTFYINEIANTNSVATLSKIGSRGEEVRRIQTKLRELGFYNGKIDGIYGSYRLL